MRSAGARFIGLLALLGLIVYAVNSFSAETDRSTLRLYFFDVGQGDAIFIETPEQKQILIDGGPGNKVLGELSKILPIGDTTLDLVILTHNHADHISGVVEVLKHYEVGELWFSGSVHTTDIYQEFLEQLRDKKVPAKAVKAGQAAKFGKLEGLVLYPLVSQQGITPENQNHTSVVTYWQYGQNDFLLTGDIEQGQEAELIGRQLLRSVEILKVPHQGSRTSSTEAFLKAVTPKIAVITVGANNRYGHPHPEILARYDKLKIPYLRTDKAGTIRFELTENGYSYKTSR